MSFQQPGAGTLAYFPCRYGNSRLLFRGPRQDVDKPYCAVVGGTETYGKFIPKPFPALVEERTGTPVVNLGCVNGGLDVFANDASVVDLLAGARVAVIQALGAHNMSNRFYVVHPRRNDRFLRASSMMKALFPSIDFAEYNFTRHLLSTLRDTSQPAFEMVVAELQMAWQARMRGLAAGIPGEKVLLRFSSRPPEHAGPDDDLGDDPLFITPHMIDSVRPYFSRVVEVEPSEPALSQGTAGMVHSEMDEPAAAALPGPAVHEEIAAALAPVVEDLMAAAR
ncbi:hypothetical protein RGUI_2900 [Rhodovulum sp. P5]|uniref:DUF6473 family protein n=1 Tax=Rhodovulum sp. P5 TaxID=1564506 RepID=UPI0009C27722|nr:DUF6473 family protein [Rhodovulum sp. P5]ARE41041.1 hypothetical protein RGUI_2900 [Rhodovulum sp. P5]